MKKYKENKFEKVKNDQSEHKDVLSVHFIGSKSKSRTRSLGDSLKDFPDEIRDFLDFPVWAVTFIVLCLVCVSVAVILYLY